MLAERWITEPSAFVELNNVESAFSKAAKSYHRHNVLQRFSSDRLLSKIELKGRVLDLGAGPGTNYQSSGAQVFCVDIAHTMLTTLKQSYPQYHAIQGDAHSLPFQSNSIDLLISNVALQWCHDFKQAITETARVIKKNGELHISMVANGSLNELTQLGLRANDFLSLNEYASAFKDDEWRDIEVLEYQKVCYFDSFKALLYSIKGVGASVPNNQLNNSVALRGREDWMKLVEQAESQRTPKGLPLTYNIVQIRAKRK
ncbi:malonyl-[acyl-carrier protein] O-methyltransferase BioC [Parashewanella curva]|uniref:malonyl-[acyl-carrier protein] O-methyltransferase n=1 Tax=Parashewanella curva TaxID=2338552 RepID=A0A3L8PTF7_9GAMM|nr:malonyl-ACP O-methyltransferase BioC [Parashewanella curva]RLV58574.1 malonyl-[acyl-carrier protein] O-methyltransferase BioC [Parashewanella curva]